MDEFNNQNNDEIIGGNGGIDVEKNTPDVNTNTANTNFEPVDDFSSNSFEPSNDFATPSVELTNDFTSNDFSSNNFQTQNMNTQNINSQSTIQNQAEQTISGNDGFVYNQINNVVDDPKSKKSKTFMLTLVILALFAVGAFAFVAFKAVNGGFGNKYKNIENKNIDMLSEYFLSLADNEDKINQHVDVEMTASVNGEGDEVEMINKMLENFKINMLVETDSDLNLVTEFSVDAKDEALISLEYIKDATKNYLKIKQLYDKYLMLDEKDLPKLSETLGFETDVPSETDMEELEKLLKEITIEDVDYLGKTYLKSMVNNIPDEDIITEKGTEIEINGKKEKTDLYIVGLKDETKLTADVLTDIKEDEKALEIIIKFCKILEKFASLSAENAGVEIPTDKKALVELIDEGIEALKPVEETENIEDDIPSTYPAMFVYVKGNKIIRRGFVGSYYREENPKNPPMDVNLSLTIDLYEDGKDTVLNIVDSYGETEFKAVIHDMKKESLDCDFSFTEYEEELFKGSLKLNENVVYMEGAICEDGEELGTILCDIKIEDEKLTGKYSLTSEGIEVAININGTVKDIKKVSIPNIKDNEVKDVGAMTVDELGELALEIEENAEKYSEEIQTKLMSLLGGMY